MQACNCARQCLALLADTPLSVSGGAGTRRHRSDAIVSDNGTEYASSLQAVLIDGAALADYRKRDAHGLIPHFHRLAEKTRDWKRPQLRDDPTGAAAPVGGI